MKTKAFTFLAGLCLVTATRAGTPATQAPGGDLWTWFTGGSAGYVTGFDAAMFAVQAGMEYHAPSQRGSHAFYLEIGYTGDDADFGFNPGVPGARTEDAHIDSNLIPITLNYRYEASLADRWNCYLGLGAGIAIVDISYDWSWSQALPPPARNHGGGSDDETDVRFYGDVFAGVSYDVNDSWRIFGGVRYILMDEQDHPIDVTGVSDYEAGINNEFLFELGARFRF